MEVKYGFLRDFVCIERGEDRREVRERRKLQIVNT